MAEIIEIEGTGDIERDLNRLPEAFNLIHARYSQALGVNWQKWIVGVDALDTRSFLHSIAAREVTGSTAGKEFVIDTAGGPTQKQVTYSLLVEEGRRPGGKSPNENHPGYAGRFPLQKSLDEQDSQDLLDQITQQTLTDFLHG